MDATKLSPKQISILGFIRGFIALKHYAPTYREIRDGLQISSTSVVEYHLRKLERAGQIGRSYAVARGLWLVETNENLEAVNA